MLLVMGVIVIAPWIAVLLLAGRSSNVATGNGPSPTSPAGVTSHQPGVAATANQGALSKTTNSDIVAGKPGPWGEIEILPMTIELPDEYLFVPTEYRQPKWFFRGFNKEQALAFMGSAGVEQKYLDELTKGNWTITADGATAEPSDEFILSMSSDTRSKVYGTLVKYAENATVIDPFWFRPGRVDFRLNGSGISAESMDLLKRLLYPCGDNLMLFADMEPALRQIKDPEERKRFVKAVSRKKSVFVRIILNAGANVTQIADYWGHDGRQKDLIPIMNAVRYNSLRGIEDNSKINILSILPPFARERLYNHAYAPTTQDTVKQDCFWSALNFFSIEPDNKVNDMAYTGEVLRRDYFSVSEPSKLGDLILLARPNGEAVHAAAFIADDIVFTKNGEAHTQPWILMHMADMLDTYKIKDPDINVRCFRRKSF